jgi:HD superfamily phosphohydrolase YqeK
MDYPDTEAQQAANDLACEEARIKAGLKPELPEDVDCEYGCILWNNGCPFTNKDSSPQLKFISLLSSTKRKGIEELVSYLKSETDFFEAPASSNNHGNYKGGLLEHSLVVYDNLRTILTVFHVDVNEDTLIIASLLHDLCKANFYKNGTRNVKHENCKITDCPCKYNNGWIKEPYYSIDDETPLGHGEKSALILQRYVPLTMEEVMAIRWHMAGFDDGAKSYAGNLALNGAMNKYPLIAALHMADLAAVNLRKREIGGII